MFPGLLFDCASGAPLKSRQWPGRPWKQWSCNLFFYGQPRKGSAGLFTLPRDPPGFLREAVRRYFWGGAQGPFRRGLAMQASLACPLGSWEPPQRSPGPPALAPPHTPHDPTEGEGILGGGFRRGGDPDPGPERFQSWLPPLTWLLLRGRWGPIGSLPPRSPSGTSPQGLTSLPDLLGRSTREPNSGDVFGRNSLRCSRGHNVVAIGTHVSWSPP